MREKDGSPALLEPLVLLQKSAKKEVHRKERVEKQERTAALERDTTRTLETKGEKRNEKTLTHTSLVRNAHTRTIRVYWCNVDKFPSSFASSGTRKVFGSECLPSPLHLAPIISPPNTPIRLRFFVLLAAFIIILSPSGNPSSRFFFGFSSFFFSSRIPFFIALLLYARQRRRRIYFMVYDAGW